MPARNRLSILSNASKADLRLDPYPHLIIENALDPEVFAELAASFPDDDLEWTGGPSRTRGSITPRARS